MGVKMLITDGGLRPMNCNSCKYHYSGRNYQYGLKGVERKEMEGFICAAFAEEEGTMVYMNGLVNDSVDHCEMFKLRGEK